MNHSEEEDRMMTVAEVADYLGFRPATIDSYIKNGKIPVYRASGRWRFKHSEIEEWLRKNTRQADDLLESRHEQRTGSFFSSEESDGEDRISLKKRAMLLLRDAGILSGLDERELEILSDAIEYGEERYAEGEIVIFNTQKMNSFLIVESGVLTIPLGAGENVVTSKQDYRRGNILGLDVMMTAERTSYFTATAREDVTVMTYSFDAFLSRRQLKDSLKIKLLANIAGLLADENIRRMKKIGMLQEKSIRGRILSYLLQAERKAGGSPFELSDNRSAIASHLGVNRSVFSNELNSMRREGIIDFDRNIFTICSSRNELAEYRKRKRTEEKKRAERVREMEKRKEELL